MSELLDRPIMVVCAGRSGSTLYYRVIARHRDVGFLSSWHQAAPRAIWVAAFSRLYGRRPFNRIKHAYWFPKPFSPYRFWDRYLPGIARHDRPLVPADVPAESIEPLRREVARILRLQGRSRFIMKVTGWARMAYFDRVFPGLRFLHLRRRPISIVASWLKAGWLNVTGEIGGEDWEWGHVPEAYMDVYREMGGGPVLSAAVKTQLDIDDIRRNVALFPGRVHELDYEELVKDPMRHFQDTLRFCDLEWYGAFERVVEQAGIRDYGERWKEQIPPDQAAAILAFFDRVQALGAECAAT
jgi:sulfotransferase family protein